MKKLIQITLKVLIWIIFMIGFLHFITLSVSNQFALGPNLYSGDINYLGNDEYLDKGCTISGFPMVVNGCATDGPFALMATINFGFAVMCGIVLAWLLIKKERVGYAIGGISAIIFIILTYLEGQPQF